MWLRRALDGTIMLLLNQNESHYHVSLALGTHAFRLCSSSTDPVVHASKHPADPVVHASKYSGFGQMWAGLQHFLQQNTSPDPFADCEEEQELRCEENDDHPRHLEEKVTGDAVTSDGYAELKSAPCAYDQGTEAKRGDPKSSSLLWSCHPPIWGGSISCRILHLFADQ